MIYQTDKICKDVRIAIDENMTSEALTALLDVETLSLDTVIKSKIEEGVTRVHSVAPLRMLDLGHNFGDSIFWKGQDTCGWAILPDDFMRLMVFMMDDWERAVYTPLNVEDPTTDKQSSRFKGVRGNPQRPKCVLAIRPEGRVLEFYSCKTQQAKVSRAVYVPYPKIDEHWGIDIAKRCYNAVIYTIASLVVTAYGDGEKSKVFDNLAESLLT